MAGPSEPPFLLCHVNAGPGHRGAAHSLGGWGQNHLPAGHSEQFLQPQPTPWACDGGDTGQEALAD